MKKTVKFALSFAAFAAMNTSVVFAATTSFTVQPGDSLYLIAQRYHTSVASLKTLNHLSGDLIFPGQHLEVETSDVAGDLQPATVSTQVVTVQPGQSLWSISQAHGVSLSQLEQWNHLTNNSILHVGEKIQLNGPSSSYATDNLSARSGGPMSTNLSEAVLGEEIAQYARQYVGYPYVYGGMSPSGFDCSGFVKFVYAHFGIYVDRTSYGQFAEGVHISESDLQPGDLVFFDTDGHGPSHVGIYLGDGEFISAQTPASGVQIASLYNEYYWAPHYIGATRIY